MFPLHVDITQDLIDEARRRQSLPTGEYAVCQDCVMALAFQAATGDPKAAAGFASVEVHKGDTVFFFDLDGPRQAIISTFDARDLVEPTGFDVVLTQLRFPILQEHIDQALMHQRGERYDPLTQCIVAVAAQAALPDIKLTCGLRKLCINGYNYALDDETVGLIQRFIERGPIPRTPLTVIATLIPETPDVAVPTAS